MIAGELEQFALEKPKTLTVGTMQSEVKSDLITLYKLERIQKDGLGYTFNKDEFDYVFANKEDQQMTVLRHYVLNDKMWGDGRHKAVVLDAMMK